jgi:hypothetical protein
MRPSNVTVKYDGITTAGLDAYEERIAIYSRDGGICQTCHKPVAFDEFELAHRIANTKANRHRWGSAVIDSPLNKCVAHRGQCNSARNIGGRPMECAALAALIRGSAASSTRSTK